jgi:hypothetical protein
MSSEQRSQVFLHRLAKPVVAVCATMFALLAAEAFVRILGRAPGMKPIQLSSYDCIYKRSMNPILGFELKANCRSDEPDFIQILPSGMVLSGRFRSRAYHGCSRLYKDEFALVFSVYG